ncbi:GDP-mannose 4,6-dehydratase [Metabacillus litoralis]|uniref:GDP-mannose 4,6-dehydratase n=1 Tax=Metabacillus litoralis TaxID=152268 RepID=UPI00203C6EA4|nr:GDP-mannose 4,6-dehydratase [Metabacillus litoralis]MCM3409933.1 GDP-mannose 4,6-dehydratase [Metabacillus litoralis]
MRVLITGANGFVGRHLLKELYKNNNESILAVRNVSDSYWLEQFGSIVLLNILDEDNVYKTIINYKPQVIIHLAAISNVGYSWGNPKETFETNVIGSLNIMKAIIKSKLDIKLINIGSSEEYGLTAKKKEILNELDTCLPQNPYAISKLSSSSLLIQLAKKHGINLIHARPFNHFGPGQNVGFVVSDFAYQIAEIKKGNKKPIISVGNLNAKRDFTDVRDVVNAYLLIINKDMETGIYNICSGTARKISSIVDELILLSGVEIDIKIDKNKYRPLEVESFMGSSAKIKEATSWNLSYNFTDSLRDTLTWWEEKI